MCFVHLKRKRLDKGRPEFGRVLDPIRPRDPSFYTFLHVWLSMVLTPFTILSSFGLKVDKSVGPKLDSYEPKLTFRLDRVQGETLQE